MNQPRRFKATLLGREGRLLAVGSEELPEPEAMHRVARRLGISATALASAGVATTLTSSAGGATSTASIGAIGTVGAAAGKATGSLVATTLVKATVIGLSLGVASYTGTRLIRSKLQSNISREASVVAVAQRVPRRKVDNVGVPPTNSALQNSTPETKGVRVVAASSVNPGEATVAAEPLAPSDPLSPIAPPVGRFEDFESPAPPPSRAPTSNTSFTNQDIVGVAAAPSAGALPVDPRLAREVRSLDLARAFANRGNSTGALSELDGFEKSFGYFALRKEAMLVKLDVLLSLGRKAEAAALARQLLLAGAPVTQRTKLEELIRSQSP